MSGMDRFYKRQEEKKSTSAATTPTSSSGGMDRYYQNQYYRSLDTSGVDDNYINSFISDTNRFFGKIGGNSNANTGAKGMVEELGARYTTPGWLRNSFSTKVEDNNITFDEAWGTIEDLGTRYDTIQGWLYKNRNNLDEETYNNLASSFDGLKSSFDSAKDYFSQWESDDDYQASMRQLGYQQKYQGKGYDEIQALVAEMQNGEEKDWLSEHAADYMTLDEAKNKRDATSGSENLYYTDLYNQKLIAQNTDILANTKMDGTNGSVLQEMETIAAMENGPEKKQRKAAVMSKMEELGIDIGDYALYAGDSNVTWDTFWNWAGKSTAAGVASFGQGISGTLDLLLGKPMQALGWENNPVSSLASYSADQYNALKYNADLLGAKMGGGTGIEYGGQFLEGLGGALPDALLAIMTAGTSTATSLSQKAAYESGSFLTKAGLTAQNMAKNPQFWVSYARTLNSDYEEAKALGANDYVAALGATISSLVNAGIEIGFDGGSGIQGLPNDLADEGVSGILAWVESSLEEGGEELLQGFVNKAVSKVLYDSETELFNPKEMATEFALGTAVGGVLGGTQVAASKGVNSAIDAWNTGARNRGNKRVYGSSLDNIQALVSEGLESAEGSTSRILAEYYQQKLDSGKSLTGAEISKLIEANEQAFRAENITSIQAAAEEKLTELGETGDVAEIARVIAKKASGETLTRADVAVLQNSKHGATVADSITVNNKNGRIDADEYVRMLEAAQLPQEAAETTSEQVAAETQNVAQAVQAEPAEASTANDQQMTGKLTGKEALQVSKDGVTRQASTGKEVTPKKIASVDGGKVMIDTDSGIIAADDIEFDTAENDLLWRGAVSFNGINTSGANGVIHAYRSDQPVATYLSGAAQEFRNGYYNMESGGEYADKLTPWQRTIIYELGQKASGENIAKAQAKATAAKKSSATVSKTEKGGKVHFDRNGRTFDQRRETALKIMEQLSKALGVEFYVYESYRNEAGQLVYKDANGNEVHAPNGYYDPKNGSIHIDLNAGTDGKGTMLFTIAHELTHFIRQWSDAKFKVLANFLVEQYSEKGVSVEKLVDAQIAKAEKNGRTIDFDTAYEEVVADSMEAILTDGNVVQMMTEMKQKDQTLWEKICDWFKNLIDDLKALVEAYSGHKPDSAEGKMVADMQDVIGLLEYFYADALVDASENYQAASEAQKNTTIDGGEEMYSFRGENKDGIEVYETSEEIKNLSIKERQKAFLAIMNEQYRGRTAKFIRNGHAYYAKFDYRDVSKNIYGDKLSDKKGWKAKINVGAEGQIFELVENARYDGSKPEMGKAISAHSGVQHWDYFVKNVQIDGTVFDLVANVRKKADGSFVYSIQLNENKKIEASPSLDSQNSGLNRMLNASKQNVAQNAEDVKEKFSLREPVEYTRDLVALHNLTEDKLTKALDLGGFPMPSIAITKADIPHTNFGEITLVFGRETIDPKASKKNVVYSADAWTPIFPQVEYEADSEAGYRINHRLNDLGKKVDDFFRDDLNRLKYGFEDNLNRYGGEEGLIQHAMENYGLRAAYLYEQGQHIEKVTTQKDTDRGFSPDAAEKYQKIMNILGVSDADEIGRMPLKEARDNYGAELEEAFPGITKTAMLMGRIFGQVKAYLEGRDTGPVYQTVTDASATRNAVDAALDMDGFEAWTRNLFAGIVKDSGIYNNKDIFTPGGSRRSFKQTHLPVTLDNIVKAMAGQNGGNTKNVSGFNGVKTLRAGTAERFKSIEAMHQREGRLQNLTQEQLEEISDALSSRMYAIIEAIDNENGQQGDRNSLFRYDSIGEILTEISEGGKYNVADIQRTFQQYSKEINDDTALEVKQLLYDVSQMPVNIFEAKPERSVRFGEVKAAILPKGTNQSIVDGLQQNGVPVQFYEKGNDTERLQLVNSMEDVKFSDRDSRTPVDNASAVDDNNLIKAGEGDNKVNRPNTDSEGNALSKGQKAFFVQSKARNQDGKLLVLYHGTANAGFTAFDPSKGRLGGNWFTTSRADADSYAGNYQHKLFDPNETDEVRSAMGGNYTLGSWMRFDTEADRADFLKQYPNAENIKTDAEYAELMKQAEKARDWDEFDRLEEEQQNRSSELRNIQKAYNRYEWEHSREATFQELFDNPEQFSMSDVLRAWDAYDSNNSVGEDDATKEELIEALREADRESIEQGDDTIADIRFKARLPVGQSGEIVNRANNRTYAVYANAVKPYEIDAGHRTLHEADLYPAIEAGLKDDGYDSVIVRNTKVGAHEETGDVVIIKEAGQVKLTSNKAPTADADIHYSERDPELEKVNRLLAKENTELKHDVAYLKELLKLQKQVTGGTKFTKTSVEAAAGQLMKYADAKGDKAELAGLLNGLYEYIARGEELTWDGVKETAQPAVEWLQNHVRTRTERSSYAQDVLKEIHGSRIYLDEQQKKEVAYQYGSYNEFRKKTMGSVILTDTATMSLDSQWHEWVGQYPNLFDPDISSTDMPAALMDVFDSLRNMTEKDSYGYDQELFGQELLSRVYDSYWNVSTLYTVKDKAQKEINKLKFDHAGRMATLKKYHEEQTAKLKQEHREALQKVKQAERERSEKKMQEISERYQESRKKGVENRRKTEMRRKIRRTIMDLNKLLNRGDKKRNVKEDMKDLVATALDTADILFMDNYSNEDMVRNGVGTEMTEQEAKYMAEVQEILGQIDSYATYQERQEAEARLKGKLDYRMSKLQDVFSRERSRLNKAKVSEVLGNLADAYASLENSEQGYVKGAFDENVHQYLLTLKTEVGGTIVKDMSLNQLDELHKAYTMVLTTVRNANKMFAANLKQTREQLGSQTINEVKQVGGEHGLWLPGEDKVNAFSWNNQKPVYAFERIGSPTLTKLFENTRAGEDSWAQDMAEAREYYLDKTKKYKYDSWDFEKQFNFTSTSGIDFTLNLEQIMSLYAYSKREQAHDHLMKGGFVFDGNTEVQVSKMGIKLTYLNKTAKAHNVSPEILGEITSKLSAEQRAFVDEMQDYLSTTMGGKGNEVSMQMYGVKLFNEKYYFPLRSAGQYMERAKEADLKKQQGQISIVNSGFTKSTTPKSSNPVVLSGFMDVWADHVNEMSMYHSFVLPMEDFRRVYNYSSPNMETGQTVSVNSVIQDAYGEAATGYIDQLYRDLNGGAVSDPRETPGKALMGKFKKAAVFASMSVVIQQPSAIGRAFAIVDPKYFVGRKVDSKRHKALWAELKQYAPVAAIKEMGYFDTGMGKSAQDFIKGKEYNTIKEKAAALFTDGDYRDELLSKAPALADELTWCSIWEAVKRETKAKNPGLNVTSEEFLQLAGKRFTEVITKTQVYDSVLSRSANMRSKGAFMSMWTAFMAEPTTTINMVEDALRKGKRGNKKYAARAMGAVFGSIVLNSLLSSLVYAIRDDDEDETFPEKYAQSFATEILDGINPLTYYPLLKDIWSALQGFDIERSDMSLITSLTEATTKLVQVLSKDTDGMDEADLEAHNKRLADAWWGVVDYVTALVGVPVKNVRRDISGVLNMVKTIGEDLNGRETTWGSLMDKAWDSVKNNIPVVGWLPDKTAADKLYEATVSGDEAYQKRLASSYSTENSLNTAIRKGLRENDSRIWEAAIAWNNNDLETYKRIAKEIVAEGNFSQDNVVLAIRAEADALAPDDEETTTTSKAKGYFTAEKFAVAVSQGNHAMAEIIKADIIETAQKNGKTADEAQKNFTSSAKSSVKELFIAGEISEQDTVNALTTYCGIDEEDAMADVQYWAFKQNYPDVYADDAWFDKYYTEVADSGMKIDLYMDYRNQVKDVTGEGKKERRMAVIDALPITNEQKDALYYSEGWAASTINEAPWH